MKCVYFKYKGVCRKEYGCMYREEYVLVYDKGVWELYKVREYCVGECVSQKLPFCKEV